MASALDTIHNYQSTVDELITALKSPESSGSLSARQPLAGNEDKFWTTGRTMRTLPGMLISCTTIRHLESIILSTR